MKRLVFFFTVVFCAGVSMGAAGPDADVIPGSNIQVSAFNARYRPAANITNGSGLTNYEHDNDSMTIWWSDIDSSYNSQATSSTAKGCAWVRFQFDKSYKLGVMWVWNLNVTYDYGSGGGFKEVVVQYSKDGVNWSTLLDKANGNRGYFVFARAPETSGYVHNTEVDFDGVEARYVVLTARNIWQGIYPGLSEVLFTLPADAAYSPQPANGADSVPAGNVDLTWQCPSGVSNPVYNVYFGTDQAGLTKVASSIADQTCQVSVGYGRDYYWRVDVVEGGSVATGNVWKFTTEPWKACVGPYAQFKSPFSATIYWDTDSPCNSVVEYGTTPALGNRVVNSSLTKKHEVTISDLEYRCISYYRVGYTDGSKEYFSDVCSFNNSINYTRQDLSGTDSNRIFGQDDLTAVYSAAAESILNQSGINNGYCLVLGSGQGRLALEIAKRSNMVVYGVDTDAAKIAKGRIALMKAGVYGSTLKLWNVPGYEKMNYTSNFFNLIVCDKMLVENDAVGSSEELYRILRPQGGTLIAGRPSNSAGGIQQAKLESWLNDGNVSYTLNTSGGVWAKAVKPAMPGAGQWVRQYGDNGNTANSGDALLGATKTSDFKIQWIGWPGGDFGSDRQVRMPAPMMCNGVMYHSGLDRIAAMDAYNGLIYWSLEIPGVMRVNMPRDGGYYAADENGIYVAVADACWFVDAASGTRQRTFRLTDPAMEWGYTAVEGQTLFGTAQLKGAHYTNMWTSASWYDDGANGPGSRKVCSKSISAYDKNTGSKKWTYSEGAIINTTISIGDGKVFFIESRNGNVVNADTGRIGSSDLWLNQYLVAIDQVTGNKLWEKSIDTQDGTVVFYMQYSSGRLFVSASNSRYYIYGFSASDGSQVWSNSHGWPKSNHGGHMQHPVVVGDRIYLEPNCYNVANGNLVSTAMARHSGCATYSGSDQTLIYRGTDGCITLQDLNTMSLTNWTKLRPSCWLSAISSGGMVLCPEGGAGCSCNGWINTSVGFMKDSQ